MSYSPTTQDGVAIRPAALATPVERLAYLRKVYTLLFTGIVAFAVTATLPVLGVLTDTPVLTQLFLLAVRIPWWASLLLIFGGSFLVHSVAMIPRINLIGFYAFAAMWGFLTVNLIAYALLAGLSPEASAEMVAARLLGGAVTLLQALGMTVLVFGGLSAYVFLSRKDFSFMGGFLTAGLVVVIGAVVFGGIASMMGYDMSVVQLAIAVTSVVLFSGYVLYDTSNILHRYATDMVVPAALALLVDFIILFRSILFLLLRSRD